MFKKTSVWLVAALCAQIGLTVGNQQANMSNADPLRIDDGPGKSTAPQKDTGDADEEEEDEEETPQSTTPQKPKYVQEFQRGSAEQREGGENREAGEHNATGEHKEIGDQRPTQAPNDVSSEAPPPKTIVIEGRIEQIADPKKDVQFPIILKKLKPKMDTRKPMIAKAQMLSGRVVNTFPVEFRGNWGGILKVTQAQINPRCNRNPLSTYLAQNVLRPGLPGHVNFVFSGTKVILLKPAQVTFMVPASVAMGQQLTGNVKTSALEVEMMREMLGNYTIPAPFSLNLGEIRTNAKGQATSFGETYKVTMLTNQIRLYAPNILEEQCVSRSDGFDEKTKKPTVDYNETVARFTLTDPDHMYVQAANIGYGFDKTFCNKVVVAGYITRGRVMPSTASRGLRDSAKLRRLQMKLKKLSGVDAKMIDQMIERLLKK